jgi:hypothetical protein
MDKWPVNKSTELCTSLIQSLLAGGLSCLGTWVLGWALGWVCRWMAVRRQVILESWNSLLPLNLNLNPRMQRCGGGVLVQQTLGELGEEQRTRGHEDMRP